MALTPVQEAQVLDLIAQQSALLSLAGVEATILSKLGATKVTLSDLPTASVIDDADLLLLRQGTTDKSVTGLTFKGLIPTISVASETVKGIVELATIAEVIAGSDTVRAVTPAGLQSKVASETVKGIVELATDAEATAGTSDLTVLTPLKLRSAINATGTAPIYACRAWVNFNGTGTPAIKASGNVTSITDGGVGIYTVNFTTAMQDTNYGAVVTCTKQGVVSTESGGPKATQGSAPDLKSTTQVQLIFNDANGNKDLADISVSIFR